jgi:hypothetical protein
MILPFARNNGVVTVIQVPSESVLVNQQARPNQASHLLENEKQRQQCSRLLVSQSRRQYRQKRLYWRPIVEQATSPSLVASK